MRVVEAPNKAKTEVRIFLAGSIEMGAAVDWQDKVINGLINVDDLLLLNPRRSDWDSSWEQTIENKQFYEQVTWELGMLHNADIIVIYFDPNTMSPISLLELGLYAASGKLIVCCPPGFWRKGNVDIVCEMYDVEVYEDLDAMIERIYQEVK